MSRLRKKVDERRRKNGRKKKRGREKKRERLDEEGVKKKESGETTIKGRCNKREEKGNGK